MARTRIRLPYMRPVEEQTAEEFAAAFASAMMEAITVARKEAKPGAEVTEQA